MTTTTSAAPHRPEQEDISAVTPAGDHVSPSRSREGGEVIQLDERNLSDAPFRTRAPRTEAVYLTGPIRGGAIQGGTASDASCLLFDAINERGPLVVAIDMTRLAAGGDELIEAMNERDAHVFAGQDYQLEARHLEVTLTGFWQKRRNPDNDPTIAAAPWMFRAAAWNFASTTSAESSSQITGGWMLPEWDLEGRDAAA